jgi:methyl coenzyme M reductase subunit C-like uncharacterized protein (methanogenesis marker protein 7)
MFIEVHEDLGGYTLSRHVISLRFSLAVACKINHCCVMFNDGSR